MKPEKSDKEETPMFLYAVVDDIHRYFTYSAIQPDDPLRVEYQRLEDKLEKQFKEVAGMVDWSTVQRYFSLWIYMFMNGNPYRPAAEQEVLSPPTRLFTQEEVDYIDSRGRTSPDGQDRGEDTGDDE